MASARIAHFCEGVNQFERIESLDGQARHVLRHNDVVQTVWPGKRVALIEQRDMVASFPALFQAGDDKITEFYDVFKQDADRVAGHEAHVLWVKPRDVHRYGYRLWADKASGLLLRADVLGESSEVLETSAFSDVVIGVKPQPELVLHAMKKLEGYRVVRPVLTATSLEAEGWSLREGVPGFRQVSCVKRPLDGGAAVKEPANSPVAADDLLRRLDARLGVHRNPSTRAATRASCMLRWRHPDADAAPWRMVGHGGWATCRREPCACSPAPWSARNRDHAAGEVCPGWGWRRWHADFWKCG